MSTKEDGRPLENNEPSSVPPRYSATTSTRSFAKHEQAPVRAQQNSEGERSVEAEGASHVDDPAVKHAQRAARETARATRLTEEQRLSIGALRRDRLRRLFSRRRTRVAIAVFAIVGLGFATLHGLSTDKPAPVSGHLAQLGAITFTEGAQADGGISPVCGCEKPHVGEWRGVTFAGRSMTLTRTGRDPLTGWVISSPEPSTVRVIGDLKRMTLQQVTLRLNAGTRFDSRWLMDPRTLSRHGTVLATSVATPYFLEFITHGSLHVSLLGSTPIAGWLPYPGSRVTLADAPQAFPNTPVVPTLTEQYPDTIGLGSDSQVTNEQQFPLGDFLGPNVVLWSNDPDATIDGTLPVGAGQATNGSEVITALRVLGSSFATRVAALPLSTSGLAALIESDVRNEPTIGVQASRYDSGSVRIDVDPPLSNAEYQAIRVRLAAHKLTHTYPYESFREVHDGGNKITMFPVEPGTTPTFSGVVTETDRYPPLPSNAGFNLFGPFPDITISDARGALLFGDRSLPLEAPSEVELKRVSALRQGGSEQTIPLPLSASNHTANLQFTAVGEVAVNGEDQTSFLRRHKALLESLTVLAAVAAALFTMIQVLQSIRGPNSAPGRTRPSDSSD